MLHHRTSSLLHVDLAWFLCNDISTLSCAHYSAGLVTRSALLEPAMVPYLSNLHCFVTLACPHLGQTSTPLSFFKTGAWAVRKVITWEEPCTQLGIKAPGI